MCSTDLRIDEAPTGELVALVSKISAELARRAAPDSAASCRELTETLAAAIDRQEAALSGLIGVVDTGREVQRWGFASTQAWLRHRLGMRDARAKERLTLTRHHDGRHLYRLRPPPPPNATSRPPPRPQAA